MRITLPILALLSCATALMAHEGVKDPDVKARMHLMMQVKDAMGTLGKMANGSLAFDASQAMQAQSDLAGYAADIPAKFESAASDAKSEALPVIWTDWDGFTKKADAMQLAFAALDASTLDTLRAGLGTAGGTCKDCHKGFREKKQ